MSEQIEPGDGWRLIDKEKDTPREGDEAYDQMAKAWSSRECYHCPFYDHIHYRRRVTSKPEPIKIRHTLIKCNSFNDVMRATNQDVSMLVGSATEARQLADWLNRYADWREAQNL